MPKNNTETRVVTVKDSIDALVARHGKSTMGIYILEQALLKALGGKNLTVDGGFPFDMPAYKVMFQAEQDIINRILSPKPATK